MFATRTHLILEPGLSPAFDVSATGENYTTPSEAREAVQDMARLSYIRGRVKYRLSFNAAESAAVVTIALKKTGGVVLGSTQIAAGGGQHYYGDFDVDLGELPGSTKTYLSVTVDTAATVAATAQVGGALDIEHPVVIAGC